MFLHLASSTSREHVVLAQRRTAGGEVLRPPGFHGNLRAVGPGGTRRLVVHPLASARSLGAIFGVIGGLIGSRGAIGRCPAILHPMQKSTLRGFNVIFGLIIPKVDRRPSGASRPVHRRNRTGRWHLEGWLATMRRMVVVTCLSAGSGGRPAGGRLRRAARQSDKDNRSGVGRSRKRRTRHWEFNRIETKSPDHQRTRSIGQDTLKYERDLDNLISASMISVVVSHRSPGK